MATVKLPGSKWFDTWIVVQTETYTSLKLEFQKYLSNEPQKHGIIYNGKHKKGQVKKVDKQGVSCET